MADMTFENVTDERTARAVIASITETGDFQTNTVLRLAGNGLDTLRLALSNELIVGMPGFQPRAIKRSLASVGVGD